MSEPSVSTEEVILHPPGDSNPPIEFDLDKFMGTWHVVFSTLSLWQSRKDVTITYTRKPQSNDTSVQFDDVVEYHSKSDLASSKRSSIIGVDTLLTPHKSGGPEETQDAAPAQTRYKWRGKGLLMIASSRWQVLGCSRDPSPGNTAAWAVTYFEKTLFTPPGLDIYARTAEGLPDSLVEEIIAKAKALGGDVGLLANTFFEVERSGVEPSKVTTSAGHRIGPVDKHGVISHMALSPS
ncbi:hypothetical protein C8Q73DRAFT_699720 [Cubamyces lactineus]|nr:hypothetical protein C8Q73DRAFT_699720 [Cubamyces lactineus]